MCGKSDFGKSWSKDRILISFAVFEVCIQRGKVKSFAGGNDGCRGKRVRVENLFHPASILHDAPKWICYTDVVKEMTMSGGNEHESIKVQRLWKCR